MKCSWKNSCVRIISFLYCTIRITKEYKWFFCRRSIFLYIKHIHINPGWLYIVHPLFARRWKGTKNLYEKLFPFFFSFITFFSSLEGDAASAGGGSNQPSNHLLCNYAHLSLRLFDSLFFLLLAHAASHYIQSFISVSWINDGNFLFHKLSIFPRNAVYENGILFLINYYFLWRTKKEKEKTAQK